MTNAAAPTRPERRRAEKAAEASQREVERSVIRPQAGGQEQFMACPADVVFYGGEAGSGKTFVELLEPLRYVDVPGFNAVIFRRTSPQIRNPGALLDESKKLYYDVGGVLKESVLEWNWPETNVVVKFAHMQHENDKYEWQGSQIALVEFDELTHFSRSQVFYMFSRMRSTCGVKPYMRATCNPDAESWVAEFISWYIGKDGYIIPERSGVIRWFIVLGDEVVWGDTREELVEKYGDQLGRDVIDPKSFTFILGTLEDNVELRKADPGYIANLLALPLVERERLLGDKSKGKRGGNWKIKAEGGKVFNEAWFRLLPVPPRDIVRVIRYWDKAGTSKLKEAKIKTEQERQRGAFTAGVLIGVTANKRYVVLDVVRGQWEAHDREDVIKRTAQLDKAAWGGKLTIWHEQEPGSGGKESAANTTANLAGFVVHSERPTGDKYERAQPFAAQVQAGNVDVVIAAWTKAYLSELHSFSPFNKLLKDQVDASSGAFNKLTAAVPWQTHNVPT
jgi:predicted phage terminase large subunit-like protein